MKKVLFTFILFLTTVYSFSQKISKEGKEIIKLAKEGNFDYLFGKLGNTYNQILEDGHIYISNLKSENKLVVLLNIGNKANTASYYCEVSSTDFKITKSFKLKEGKLIDFDVTSVQDLFRKIGFNYNIYENTLSDLLEFISNPKESKIPDKYFVPNNGIYNLTYYVNSLTTQPQLRIYGAGGAGWIELETTNKDLLNLKDVKNCLSDFQYKIYSKINDYNIKQYVEEAKNRAIKGRNDIAKYYYEHVFGFLNDSLYNKNLKYEFDKNSLLEIAYLFSSEPLGKKSLFKSIYEGQYQDIFDFRDRLEGKGSSYTKGLATLFKSEMEDAIMNYEFKKSLKEKNAVVINPTLAQISEKNGKKKLVIFQNPNIYKSFFKESPRMGSLFQWDDRDSFLSFIDKNYELFLIDETSPIRESILKKYELKPEVLRTLLFLDENGAVLKTIHQNTFTDFVIFQDECLKEKIIYIDYEKLNTLNSLNKFSGILKEFVSCNYSEATINQTLPSSVLLNPNLGFHRGFGRPGIYNASSVFYSNQFANVLGVDIYGIDVTSNVKNINFSYVTPDYAKLVKREGQEKSYTLMSDREARDFFKTEKELERDQKVRDQYGWGMDWSSNKREYVDNSTRYYENYGNLDLICNDVSVSKFKMYNYYLVNKSDKIGTETFTNAKNKETWILNTGRWIATPIYYTLRNRGCRTFAKSEIENMKKVEARLYTEALSNYNLKKFNLAYQKADSLLYFNEITDFYPKTSKELINTHIIISNILFQYAKYGAAPQNELDIAAYKAYAHFAFVNLTSDDKLKRQAKINMAYILAHEKSFFNDFLQILPSDFELKISEYSDINMSELEKKTSLLKLSGE